MNHFREDAFGWCLVQAQAEYDGSPGILDRMIAAEFVTKATLTNERETTREHAWRCMHLVSPNDRALGLGKWRSTVAHNVARMLSHDNAR